VQYLFAVNRLPALASFSAGLAGVLAGIFISRVIFNTSHTSQPYPKITPSLKSALFSYGLLMLLMLLITLIPPVNQALGKYIWSVSFPEVKTFTGFLTASVPKQIYRPLLHPGSALLVAALFGYIYNQRASLYNSTNFLKIVSITLQSSWPALVGILCMVGLSQLMDHTGMTLQLADALSKIFQSAFPLVSPFIGMLGAFATGSNNNSNVLFGSLQEGIAVLLRISPAIIVAAQTTGGSLGSMIAPAKIIVGCSTVNLQGRDGEIMRITLPYGLVIGLVMGVATLVFVNLHP
jgi:lactate permease